jgi:Ca2+-binding RTX toxin-like protein
MTRLHRLEGRRLLSAIYDPSAGVLSVNGTGAADSIRVELFLDAGSGDPFLRATVNGVQTAWTTGDVIPARIIVSAGAGDDTVVVSRQPGVFIPFPEEPVCEVYAADGNDRVDLFLTKGGLIDGGPGNDTLRGGEFADSLHGGDGDDALAGGGDFVPRDTRDDTLDGGDGADILYGQGGADSLLGGPGDDTLRAQAGDDTLQGEEGDDILHGDTGIDTVTYAYTGNSIRASIGDGPDDGPANDPSDRDDVQASIENLFGGNGDDTLIGDAADNLIRGNVNSVAGGIDHLFGRAGDDRLEGGVVLSGGRGDDTLYGGHGRDLLLGGSGNDLLDGGFARDTVNGGAGLDTHNEGMFESLDQTVVMTGQFRFVQGGFGSLWRLVAGADDSLILDITRINDRAQELEGRRVAITGHFAIQNLVERGDERVLVAESIRAA